MVVFALVQSPGAHERSPALPAAPGGALVHRDAQQLCRVDVFVLHAQPQHAAAPGHDKSPRDLPCPYALCVVNDPVGGAELSFKPRVDDVVPL